MLSAAGLRSNGFQKCRWRQNGDSLKGMERQLIGVTGEDEIGAAMHGNLQKFVVAGIAAGADGGGNSNEDCNME